MSPRRAAPRPGRRRRPAARPAGRSPARRRRSTAATPTARSPLPAASAPRRAPSPVARRRGSRPASVCRLPPRAATRRRRRPRPVAPCAARCAPRAASASCRARRASSSPSSAAAPASASRPSSINVATDSMREYQHESLAPLCSRRDREPAREVRQRALNCPSAAARAAVHPERRQARRQLLGGEPLERGARLVAAPRRSRRGRASAPASAPRASAAASNTGSPIARASSRASLACAWLPEVEPSRAVSASASRKRMRSGDGCAGSSPSATCSRRRAGSWPPSHHSWLASATVTASRSLGRRAVRARRAASCARRRGSPRRRLRVGEQLLHPRAALAGSGRRAAAAARRHGSAPRSPGAGDCSCCAAALSSSIACSSPSCAACSTWCARCDQPGAALLERSRGAGVRAE